MIVSEENIAKELRRLAEQARPVDPIALAAKAGAGARRKRRFTWSMAGLAAAAVGAAAVTVVSVLPFPVDQGSVATRTVRLPDNTPEQLRKVRECMPKGGPVHSMDGNRRIPEHGDVSDFRLLVEVSDRYGSTALVGSTAGFVLCTPAARPELADNAVFAYWGSRPPGDLAGFAGSLQVDAYTVTAGTQVEGEQVPDRFRVVAGRVADDVRRVEVDWGTGERTDAQVANGFFVARTVAESEPDPEGAVDAFDRPLRKLRTPPVTVTAYDADGQVVGRQANISYRPIS